MQLRKLQQMNNILKWTGWSLACILFLLLCLQRSCTKNCKSSALIMHDTITVKGDRQLIKVQDTILKPFKIVYKIPPGNIDTGAVLKNYFAQRIYMDTIRARDVTA